MAASLRRASGITSFALLLACAAPAIAAGDGGARVPPSGLAVLDRVDRLLVEGRGGAADSLADSLLVSVRRDRDPDLEFAVLDSVSRRFERRTFSVLALRSTTRLLEAASTRWGPAAPELGRCLNRHAQQRFANGDGAGAVAEQRRALAIAAGFPPEAAEERIQFEEDLATYFRSVGAGDSAMIRYRHCLEARRALDGAVSYPVARTLAKLATGALEIGSYTEARQFSDQSAAIAEQVLAPDDPRRLTIYNNRGAVLGTLNDNVAVAEIFTREVRLAERAYGLFHKDTARYMNNAGLVEYAMQHFARARVWHDSALAIRARIGDVGGVTESLKNLALVDLATGETARAESLFQITQARCLGGWAWNTLAEIYGARSDLRLRTGRFAEAEVMADSQAIALSHYAAREHPWWVLRADRVARARFGAGDRAGAFRAALDVDRMEAEHIARTARTLAERQVFEYERSRPRALDLACTIAAAGLSPDDREALWSAEIRGRARILDEMAERHRIAAASGDSTLRGLFQALATAERDLGRRIASTTARTPASDSALEAARNRVEGLERSVADRDLAHRLYRQSAGVEFSEIRRALPEHAALVAFTQYREVRMGRGATPDSIPQYAAFVLSDRAAPVAMKFLGPAARVDSLVGAWRRAAARRAPDPLGAGRAEREYRRVAARLRDAVWTPVAELVGRASTVFLVPDGTLSLVNFAALPVGDSRYLVETGPLLHVLSSERDLLHEDRAPTRGAGFLAFAAPDFETRACARSVLRGAEVVRGPLPGFSSFSALRFAPLPATAREVDLVAATWRQAHAGISTIREGAAADEASFKSLAPGRRVIHLATHGFFLDPVSGIAADRTRAALGPLPDEENPLRLSGLALAGANRRANAPADAEDGILTAEEISALDLQGVEWVVLSACNTGVGDVQANEGVSGLRRAFAIAGAGTTIMSLWPVEDRQASRWMAALYAARFARRETTAAAVRDADCAVLWRLRRLGLPTPPSAWAAFLAAGDWR